MGFRPGKAVEGSGPGRMFLRRVQLADRGLSLVSEGSIYPVLSRLEQGGYIEGYREPSPEGPSRKYYRLLPQGRRRLAQGTAEWEQFVHGVNRIVRQGEADESD